MISRNPNDNPKRVGVDMPASGKVRPPGVGEACAICPVVGVGVEVDVTLGGDVGVGVGLLPPIGLSVGVRVTADVTVGVASSSGVGVKVVVAKENFSCLQATGAGVSEPEF